MNKQMQPAPSWSRFRGPCVQSRDRQEAGTFDAQILMTLRIVITQSWKWERTPVLGGPDKLVQSFDREGAHA
jgi:hypothetical protein